MRKGEAKDLSSVDRRVSRWKRYNNGHISCCQISHSVAVTEPGRRQRRLQYVELRRTLLVLVGADDVAQRLSIYLVPYLMTDFS